jgi:hypothetical protein
MRAIQAGGPDRLVIASRRPLEASVECLGAGLVLVTPV